MFIDRTSVEGVADNIEVGVLDPASLTAGHRVPEEEDTDQDLEGEPDDAASSLSKPRSSEVEKESALEVLLACF